MAAPIQIVYIGASWCSTCKTIGPATEALCKKYGVELRKLDYDHDMEEDEKESITKVPTLRAIHNGAVVAEWNQNQIVSLEIWLGRNAPLQTVEDF